MRPKQVEALGKRVYAAHPTHRKTLPTAPTYLLGFDSEYHYPDPAAGPVPLCYQLHDGEFSRLEEVTTPKLSLKELSSKVYRMRESYAPQAKKIVLLSWWSQAEISILNTDGLDVEVIPQGNALFGLRWTIKPARRPAIQVQLLDLSAYLANADPNSPRGYGLAKAAEEAGLKKLDFPKERLANLTRDDLNDEEFRAYALNDAKLCAQIGEMLFKEHALGWGLNPFGTVSVGHLSTVIYRHEYITEDLWQPNPDVRELALLAYRGSGFAGGLWARGIFDGPHAEFDAVSNYPSAAREVGVLPRRQDWFPWAGGPFQDRGIYRAEFKWPAEVKHRMLMASVQRENSEGYGYPQFGVDTFSGFELMAAQRLGCQIRIIDGWEYNNGTDSVSQFLSHLVTHREKNAATGNKLMRRHYKALGNVFIGKLGQHIQHDRLAVDEHGEFYKMKSERHNFSGVYMPEWWVLIVGYAKAVFGEVCAEFGALHGNVDAVLIQDPGVDEFTRRGITFKRNASGDRLKLIDRNTWALYQDGQRVRAATFGGAQGAATWAALDAWEGQEVAVELTTQHLVRLQAAAGTGGPLLSKTEHTKTMRLPAADKPLEAFEKAVDIRPVERPARRKPGDPLRGEQRAAMLERLAASRSKA